MKKLLLTTVALVLAVGQAAAKDVLLSREETYENSPVLMGMAKHVKALPAKERDQWAMLAAASIKYNTLCAELPLKVRLAVAGTMMGTAESTVEQINRIEREIEVTGAVEFCAAIKPAIEGLVRNFDK